MSSQCRHNVVMGKERVNENSCGRVECLCGGGSCIRGARGRDSNSVVLDIGFMLITAMQTPVTVTL